MQQAPDTSGKAKARQGFVALSGTALTVFFLFQMWATIGNSGPSARVVELSSVIGAEQIQKPMSQRQADFQVELLSASSVAKVPLISAIAAATKNQTRGLVFLNFWATWCKPCVRELPSMLELKRAMNGYNFSMLAVSYDDDWSTINSFFRRVFGGTPRELILARDPAAGAEERETLKYAFGTRKLPETYVIKNGRVLTRFVNERNWTDPAIVEYFKRLAELP